MLVMDRGSAVVLPSSLLCLSTFPRTQPTILPFLAWPAPSPLAPDAFSLGLLSVFGRDGGSGTPGGRGRTWPAVGVAVREGVEADAGLGGGADGASFDWLGLSPMVTAR